MEFRSKVDFWLVLVLALALALPTVFAARAVANGGPWLPQVAIAVALPALFAWMLWPTRYSVAENLVHIQCGPLRWSIDVHTITEVTPSRSLRSGPALSLDRLKIEYGHGRSVLVSPEHREEFIAAIRSAQNAASPVGEPERQRHGTLPG